MPKHPDYEPDEVIERLSSENRQCLEIINQIKLVLGLHGDSFQGLTAIGAVKNLLKRLHNQENKIFRLEKEIKQLRNKK